MPELPEVETIARGLDARVRGDRIIEAWFSGYREPFKTPPKRQASGLQGRTILAVHRTGKHIVCELGPADGNRETGNSGSPRSSTEPQAQWIVHLGMSGRILVAAPDAPIAPHTHARLSLAGGLELRFIDPRRFGRLEFRDLGRAQGFSGPGAEPLTIAPADFAALFRGRKLAIKAALLNQRLLSGVGNIYADESLFRAGIRPGKGAGKLTRKELDRLRIALRDVLSHAIRLGGSSVSDYVGADGERGFFQIEHRVYRRTGQRCLRCGTPIRRTLIAGRGTHYCPHCQR
jgi:formamidopyrimidine-DNA glycosylase